LDANNAGCRIPAKVQDQTRLHESWIDENGDEVPTLKHLKHDTGNLLNKALAAVEDENDALAGVLKKNIDFNAVKSKTKIPDQKWKDPMSNIVKSTRGP